MPEANNEHVNLRIGTVTAADESNLKVRVKFKDTNTPSGWLTVLQRSGETVSVQSVEGHTHPAHTTFWMPKVNDTVLVIYLPAFNADGFVLGGMY